MASIPDLQSVLERDPESLRRLTGMAGTMVIDLLMAGIIIAITIWASKFLSRAVQKGIPTLTRGDPTDTTLPQFAGSVVRYAVFAIGLIAAVQQLGVQTTSILAVLGAASLAIGLALQGALGNVAAGVLLLVLRPYKVGDKVELSGKTGKVHALTLFNTELTSDEGLQMILPNGKILGDLIINYSAHGRRRFEVTVAIDYDDNLDRALSAMLACAKEDDRVLPDPAPWAKVTGVGDHGVNVTLRAWVKESDYTDAKPDMVKRVKESFDREGFSFPYPHTVEMPFELAHPEKAARLS